MGSLLLPANCPACRARFSWGFLGVIRSVSKKPNEIKAESLHNTNLSDVTYAGQPSPAARTSLTLGVTALRCCRETTKICASHGMLRGSPC